MKVAVLVNLHLWPAEGKMNLLSKMIRIFFQFDVLRIADLTLGNVVTPASTLI